MIRLERSSPEIERKIEILKEKFLEKLPPKFQEDQTIFYRFLKARDFNLDLAESMLEKHISDFKVFGVENVASYVPPEHLKEYYPDSFMGYDKEGCVVRYCDAGRFDFKGVFSKFEFKEMANYQYSLYYTDIERMTAQTKKLGKSVSQMVYIINTEKLGLYMATYKKGIETLRKAYKMIQDNYPERIKAIYIINSSIYFNLAFSLLKTVVAGALLEKIHIFGKDEWKEVLLDIIDADELPAFLGGKKTDPDGNPLCESFVVHGKKMPPHLYEKQNRKSLSQEDGVKKLIVTRFSSAQLKFDIDEPNSHIEWEFETEVRDIGFALYYKNGSEADSELEELIPKQRIDTAIATEVGVFKCDKKGTFIVEFDNSYSWFYSKEIYYRIRVVKQPSSDTV